MRLPRIASILVLVFTAVTAGAGATEADARCVRLENRIADLRLKMRLGYTTRQGRTYRQKLAGLEAERREVCRR